MDFIDEVDDIDDSSNNFEFERNYFKQELDVFKKYFDKNLFAFEYYRNFIYVYYKYPGIDLNNIKESAECLKIRLKIDENQIVLMNLKYVTPSICKISGVELLYLLYKVAKELKMNILIENDASYKSYDLDPNSKTKCVIHLDKYYILLKGISWYGLYGYFSESHPEELDHNETVRNMSIIEYFDNNENKVSEIVAYINQNNPNGEQITSKISVKDLMEIIDKIKRKMERESVIYCNNPLIKIIQDIIKQRKIEYNDEDLELNINDQNVDQIYNNLSSKITMTSKTIGGKKRAQHKKGTLRKLLKKRHYRKKTNKKH